MRLPKLTSASGPQFESAAAIDRHVRASVHSGSSLYNLDSELLEQLEPDLIVTQELCAVCAVSYDIVSSAVKRLRSDARVVSLEPTSLQDVFATIVFLGEITDHADKARSLVARLEARIEKLRRSAESKDQGGTALVRTLLLEWTDPPMSAGHWIPELIEIAGGVAILANPGANSQRIDWEAIDAADPDAVIVAPCGFDLEKTRRAVAELATIEQWRNLRAVRNESVLALDGNAYMSRPGPRLVDAAEIVARWYTERAEYAG